MGLDFSIYAVDTNYWNSLTDYEKENIYIDPDKEIFYCNHRGIESQLSIEYEDCCNIEITPLQVIQIMAESLNAIHSDSYYFNRAWSPHPELILLYKTFVLHRC